MKGDFTPENSDLRALDSNNKCNDILVDDIFEKHLIFCYTHELNSQFLNKKSTMRYPKKSILSKSRFLAGEQCHLRLWYSCFNRDLATPVSPAQQGIFDTGHEVGELATRLYPRRCSY